MNANDRINKTRRALQKLKAELQEEGETKQVEALTAVLSNEMSLLRLAAIMAPEN